MKIIVTLFMLLSCKGLNNLNPSYKDRTATLKKIYLELKKDDLDLNKIILLLKDFEKDRNNNITIDHLIDTKGIFGNWSEGSQSLMHLAVKSTDNKSLELMRLLKNNMNADVNIKNHLGETPLHLACESGDKDKIRLLLKMGADVKAKDNYGTTPLVAHILGDSLSWEVFNEFLGSLYEVNVKIEPELKTMLHLLCDNFWKNPEAAANIIKMLAREGSDFKARDIKGNTLLHSVVLASIAHGVEPNVTIEMIDLLMRYGVDPKAINKDNNRTILHIATEYAMDEDVIRYLTDIVGAIQPEPYKVVEDRFIEMIKSYGNVDIEGEGKRNAIHDTLQALWIQEDDFIQENTKFLKLLAALFYARWTNDKLIPSMESNFKVDIYRDVDKTLKLDELIILMNNLKEEDIDEDLKKEHIINGESLDIFKVSLLFSKSLFQINSGIHMNARTNPLTKIKFQKLVSCLPKIKGNVEKERFVINTLLRQFTKCEVAITLGLDQVFSYLGEITEESNGVEEIIYKYINDLKKNLLIQALRETNPFIKIEQSHFDLQILKYFAEELNLLQEYDDPYNIGDNFDADVIRNKFYEKYTCSLVMEMSKKILMEGVISAKLFEYIQKVSGAKNVHLAYKVFFDKNDYLSKEEFIKALLIFMGHLKSKR